MQKSTPSRKDIFFISFHGIFRKLIEELISKSAVNQLFILMLPFLCISENCIETKIKLKFYFYTLHKAFWGTKKKCENKKYFLFVRVNAYTMNIFVVYVCCKNNVPCIVDLTGRRTSEFWSIIKNYSGVSLKYLGPLFSVWRRHCNVNSRR